MIDLTALDAWRVSDPRALATFGGWIGDETCGAFSFSRRGAKFAVVASSSGGWDHVSVSLPNRCPTWDEMEWIKHRFFLPHETAMQLHVPATKHVNLHPYCLHLWRPHDVAIPLPPRGYV